MKPALALCAAVALATAAGIENIPTGSRLYDDFDLLRTSGLIRSMPPASRPWTRAEAVRLLVEADSLSTFGPCGSGQRAALRRLLTEFAAELPGPPAGVAARRPVARLAVPEGPDDEARVDLFSRIHASRDAQSASIGTVLNNRPGDRFCFYDRIEVSVLRPEAVVVGDSAGYHIPGKRLQPWQGHLTFDMEEAYVALRAPWFRFAFGRDEFYWGPGHTGSVMLDDDAPSLNNIQFVVGYPGFRFESFSAFLSRWQLRPRFLSAQRLEVSIARCVTLGGAMMAVASWDTLQPFELAGLMNPLLPVYFTCATLGHGDNFLIGWDATVYLPQTKVYAQLFLDNYEFNSRRDAPNALGLQAGGYWASRLPVELRAEYTRVTAFTYFHRRHDLMYENWLVPLGHPLGPDADQAFGSLRYSPLEWLRFTLGADYTRRGFYNRGDFTRMSFYVGESLPAGFPSLGITATGDTLARDWQVDQTLRLAPSLELTPTRDLRLLLGAALWASRNYQGIPGVNKTSLDLDLRVEYRY